MMSGQAIRLRWGSAADAGRIRKLNQDTLLADPSLFIIADGMGGHRGGEVASKLAIETMRKGFLDAPDRTPELIHQIVCDANDAVVKKSAESIELSGMGTTVCAMARVSVEGNDVIAIANVGDSRAYLLKSDDNELVQITEDHSLVATLLRHGRLTEREALVHPQRNVLIRALGIEPQVSVDLWEIEPVVGDRYVLCSDGLFNEVDDQKIVSVLRRLANPQDVARELVRIANDHGGKDNISVIVVDVFAVDESDMTGLVLTNSPVERILRTTRAPDTVDVDRLVPLDASSRYGVVSNQSKAGDSLRARNPEMGTQSDSGTSKTPIEPSGWDANSSKVLNPTEVSTQQGNNFQRGINLQNDSQEVRVARFTWRVVMFLFACFVLFAITFAGVGWFARHTYYVGINDATGNVAIYQGRPEGVLWMDPLLKEETDIAKDKIPVAFKADVLSGKDEPSLTEAQRYVQNMREQMIVESPAITIVPETETSVPESSSTISTTITTAPIVETTPSSLAMKSLTNPSPNIR